MTMTNTYTTAFASRIKTAIEKNSTKSNIERLQRNQAIVSNQTIAELFTSSQIDASRMLRAMYASFKAIEFAAIIIDHKDANNEKNTYAVFRSVLNCKRANLTFTKRDAICSISRDQVITDEAKKNVLFVRSAILDEKTINAQHQTSIDALVTLNILKKSDTFANAYEININSIAIALAKKLDIEIDDLLEVTDERVNADAELEAA
ncbi:hypothetical protein [Agrobacterium sp. CG674]